MNTDWIMRLEYTNCVSCGKILHVDTVRRCLTCWYTGAKPVKNVNNISEIEKSIGILTNHGEEEKNNGQ